MYTIIIFRFIYIYIHICVYIYVYIYIYIHMYVCIYIYTCTCTIYMAVHSQWSRTLTFQQIAWVPPHSAEHQGRRHTSSRCRFATAPGPLNGAEMCWMVLSYLGMFIHFPDVTESELLNKLGTFYDFNFPKTSQNLGENHRILWKLQLTVSYHHSQNHPIWSPGITKNRPKSSLPICDDIPTLENWKDGTSVGGKILNWEWSNWSSNVDEL